MLPVYCVVECLFHVTSVLCSGVSVDKLQSPQRCVLPAVQVPSAMVMSSMAMSPR